MKIVLMGSSSFSILSFESIVKEGYNIVGVYTQPPKIAGRGQKIKKTLVHEFAQANEFTVFTPVSLKKQEEQHLLERLNPDVIVVIAYGLVLPKAVLYIPKFGCINVHASILPRWRGASPIQRSIEYGDNETGITIMQMNEKLDEGNIIMQHSVNIKLDVTSEILTNELSILASSMIIQTLDRLKKGKLYSSPQSQEGVTYAKKLSKKESLLDWNFPAVVLERKVRAFNPWPGTYFFFNGKRIKVFKAKVILNNKANTIKVGTVIDNKFTIACKKDFLRLELIQEEGGKKMLTEEFLKGHFISIGHSIL